MNILLPLLALGVSISLLLVWAAARQLMARPIRRAVIEARAIDELPPHLKSRAFEDALNRLQLLGFRPEYCQAGESMFGANSNLNWALHCIHDQERVMAVIHAPSLAHIDSVKVSFYSRDRSGGIFTSLSRQKHLYIEGMPGWTLDDTQTDDPADGFKIHLERRKRYIAEPTIIEEQAWITETQNLLDGYVSFLKSEGWTKQVSDNEYRFRFFPSLRLAVRVLAGELRAKKVIGKSNVGSHSQRTSASPELALEMYRRFEAYASEARPIHWTIKLTVFAISAIVFCVVLGFVFPLSWVTVLLLAVALLIHELGHLAGMWIFGYRDLQILFIPAFGAVTTASREEAEPWQRVIVLFLGPLPGLILGGVLLLAWGWGGGSEESWLFQLSVLMLVVNYMNLLPFLPFDGGWIVDVAIAQRFPYFTTALTSISIVAFAVAGVYFTDAVLFALAAILLFALRSQWRLANAQHALSDLPSHASADEVLHRIFAELSKPSYARIGFSTKASFARKFLRQRIQKPSRLFSASSLAVQTIILVAPLIVWIVLGRD